jgi:diketogulonate reductase-like aldo/keto reductase
LKVAKRHGATPAQILIAWGLKRGTSVIPKSVSAKRLGENFGAGQVMLALGDDDMKDLDGIRTRNRFISPDWTPMLFKE